MTHATEQRWIATPSELVTRAVLKRKPDPDFQYRFFSKVDFGFAEQDCWIWTGALSDEGYGNFTVGRHTVRAHRVAYLIEIGEPPADRPFLDHVNCLGRFCINPKHLEPVDNEENTRRGRGTGKTPQRELRRGYLAVRLARRAALTLEIPVE